MSELFGIPTSAIAIVLSCLFGLAVLTVALTALANPTMFRLGIRNLPRRGAQTVLVVAGLMLSTLIVTAAFVTGDTIDYSLTSNSYELFGRQDLDITINNRGSVDNDFGATLNGEQVYVPASAVDTLEAQFGITGAGDADADIQGFQPILWEQVPAVNTRNHVGAASVQLAGLDPARMDRVRGLQIIEANVATVSELGADDVLLSQRASAILDARTGDTIDLHFGTDIHTVTVRGIVQNELASGVLGMEYSDVPGGIAMRLDTLQEWTGHAGQVNAITVNLAGGVRGSLLHADAAAARVASFLATPEGRSALPLGERAIEVTALKKNTVEDAEATGNLFTTFFLVLGLFSMASGVMLIFMIFVMLASERRAELGIARAVGAQRRHLLQSFVSEGLAYSLLSGIAGAALGVAASAGLTLGLMKIVGGDYFSLVEFHMTWKSIVIGYTLGVVLTFLTVVIAANNVTRVNIVAAIRNLPDDKRRESRRKTRWLWVAIGVPALVVPPLGLWFLLRKGFGLPWAWIMGPLGIVAGILLIQLGTASETLFPFALGVSLLPLSTATLARYYRAPARPTWTAVGILLIAYWLLPPATHDALFGEFDSDIEMFVLAGIMVVIGATLMIVFNAGILTVLFTRGRQGPAAYRGTAAIFALAVAFAAGGVALGDSGDGLGQLAFLLSGLLAPAGMLALLAARVPALGPSLKMAVAYPLANRFRTGMTIAMFSLIVFSLTVFSVLLANFGNSVSGEAARGNLDVMATSGLATPVEDVLGELRSAGSPVVADIAASGRTTLGTGSQQVRRAGVDEWAAFPVLSADDNYFADLQPALDARAHGYASDAAILEAVRTTANLALIDRNTILSDFSALDFLVEGIEFDDDNGFDPFTIEMRDPVTGKATAVTVIGAIKVGLDGQLIGGLYINQATYEPVFGPAHYQRTYFRLNRGADLEEVAAGIESALAVRGVKANSVQELLNRAEAQNVTFNRMFQSFMALGLVVGIAGLGVIAFRSVVERRQQIGMLRAIGFQRGTISLAFLLESSFIAVMGIASGVVGGAIMARNLLTSPDFTEGTSIDFTLPWVEIVFMIAAALGCSLLMTWLPSRCAARVPVADALRYE